MRTVTRLLPVVLGLALMLPSSAIAQTRAADRCFMSADNWALVFHDVPKLSPMRAVALRGLLFRTVGVYAAYAFDGRAVASAQGTVRFGAWYHTSPSYTHMSAITDSNLAGTFRLDLDGDGLDDDLFIDFYPVACSTFPQPY
jgi:hypothetical protein